MRNTNMVFITLCVAALIAAPPFYFSANHGSQGSTAFAGDMGGSSSGGMDGSSGSSSGGMMGGTGGYSSDDADCGGRLPDHSDNHSTYCGDGTDGGMCGGGMSSGGSTYPNCIAGHHRLVQGGDCVPCPDLTIATQGAARVSPTRVLQHSGGSKARPPISIGNNNRPIGTSHVPKKNTKPAKSVTGR